MSSILLRASAMEEKSLSATDRGTSLSCKGFRNQHLKKRNTNSHLEESHEESAILKPWGKITTMIVWPSGLWRWL